MDITYNYIEYYILLYFLESVNISKVVEHDVRYVATWITIGKKMLVNFA